MTTNRLPALFAAAIFIFTGTASTAEAKCAVTADPIRGQYKN